VSPKIPSEQRGAHHRGGGMRAKGPQPAEGRDPGESILARVAGARARRGPVCTRSRGCQESVDAAVSYLCTLAGDMLPLPRSAGRDIGRVLASATVARESSGGVACFGSLGRRAGTPRAGAPVGVPNAKPREGALEVGGALLGQMGHLEDRSPSRSWERRSRAALARSSAAPAQPRWRRRGSTGVVAPWLCSMIASPVRSTAACNTSSLMCA
jgi:hypothetical protein